MVGKQSKSKGLSKLEEEEKGDSKNGIMGMLGLKKNDRLGNSNLLKS